MWATMPTRVATASSEKTIRFILFLLFKILSTTLWPSQMCVHSLRQLRPSLLRHHVLGVPVGPVRVRRANALLMLSVRHRRAPHRVRQVVRRSEARRRGIYDAGQPRRDFLEQPAVAVRIFERRERAVAAVLGIRTADAHTSKQEWLVRARVHAFVVKHLANLDATIEQLFAGGLEVGDDQVHALGGAGRRRGDVPAEYNRAPGARRRELHHAKVFTIVEVGVQPPPELRVELLSAV